MGAFISSPIRKFGAWLARVDNTNYLAATDGMVCAIRNSFGDLKGFTDAGTPPGTLRQRIWCDEGIHNICLSFPVRKGDYWKTIGADVIFWIPES